MKFKTLSQRIEIYKRMLEIYKYGIDKRVNYFPTSMIPEYKFSNDTCFIFGFCFFLTRLTGIDQYDSESFKINFPELYAYRPTENCSWFDSYDLKSRYDILKELIN